MIEVVDGKRKRRVERRGREIKYVFVGAGKHESKDARLEGTSEIHCGKKTGEGSEKQWRVQATFKGVKGKSPPGSFSRCRYLKILSILAPRSQLKFLYLYFIVKILYTGKTGLVDVVVAIFCLESHTG
jgi:hypothetical protein